MGSNSFSADANSRGGSPLGMNNPSPDQRGGIGANGQEPHSSSGFRRALMKTARSGNKLKDQLPSGKGFSGQGFRKPNYAFQGGQRHGMYIGSGAPFTGPAAGDAGDGFGGGE